MSIATADLEFLADLNIPESLIMSARDKFHQIVRVALERDRWIITHDPFHIDLGFVDFYIDLGAEQLLLAAKENEKIAVEIKTFLVPSVISEFHTAIGQFINYQIALEDNDPERLLYLAIPSTIHKRLFRYPFIQTVVHRNQIPLIVYDVETQEIVQWIK